MGGFFQLTRMDFHFRPWSLRWKRAPSARVSEMDPFIGQSLATRIRVKPSDS